MKRFFLSSRKDRPRMNTGGIDERKSDKKENGHVTQGTRPERSVFKPLMRQKRTPPILVRPTPTDRLSTQPRDVLNIVASYLESNDIIALARANYALSTQLQALGRLGMARVALGIKKIGANTASDKTFDRVIRQLGAAKHDPAAIEQMVKLAETLPSKLSTDRRKLNPSGQRIFSALISLSHGLAPLGRDRVLLAVDRALRAIHPPRAVAEQSALLCEEWKNIITREFGDSVAFVALPEEETAAKSRNVPILLIGSDSKIHVSLPGRTSKFAVDTFSDAKILCQLTSQTRQGVSERYGDRVAYLAERPDQIDKSKPAIWPSRQYPGQLGVFVPGARIAVAKDFNAACDLIDPFLHRKNQVDVRYNGRVAYLHLPIEEKQRSAIRTPTIFRPNGEHARTGAVEVAMPNSTGSHRAARMDDAFKLIDSIEDLRQTTEKRFKKKVAFIGGPSSAAHPGLSVRVARDALGLELWLPNDDKPIIEKRLADTPNMAERCAALVKCAHEIFPVCASLAQLDDRIQLVRQLPERPAVVKSGKPIVAINEKDPTKLDLWIPGEQPVTGLEAKEVIARVDPWRDDPVEYAQTVANRFGERVTFEAQRPQLFRSTPAIWPGAKGSFHVWMPKVGIYTVDDEAAATNFRRAMAIAEWALDAKDLPKHGKFVQALPGEWNGLETLYTFSSGNPLALDALVPGTSRLSRVDMAAVKAAAQQWTAQLSKYQEQINKRSGYTVDLLLDGPKSSPTRPTIWPSRTPPGAFRYTLPGVLGGKRYLANQKVDDVSANLKYAMDQIETASRFSELVREKFGKRVVFFPDTPQPTQIPPNCGAIWINRDEIEPRFRYALPNSNQPYKMKPGVDETTLKQTIESMERAMKKR